MNQLEMCKAMAELEGAELDSEASHDSAMFVTHFFRGEAQHSEYNPITDLALNCMLRDKHEVAVEYINKATGTVRRYVVVNGEWRTVSVNFDRKQDIPHAVIECILKSKGKWK